MDPRITPPPGMEITAPLLPEYARVLTPEALSFVAKLARRFGPRRLELVGARGGDQRQFEAGAVP